MTRITHSWLCHCTWLLLLSRDSLLESFLYSVLGIGLESESRWIIMLLEPALTLWLLLAGQLSCKRTQAMAGQYICADRCCGQYSCTEGRPSIAFPCISLEADSRKAFPLSTLQPREGFFCKLQAIPCRKPQEWGGSLQEGISGLIYSLYCIVLRKKNGGRSWLILHTSKTLS